MDKIHKGSGMEDRAISPKNFGKRGRERVMRMARGIVATLVYVMYSTFFYMGRRANER